MKEIDNRQSMEAPSSLLLLPLSPLPLRARTHLGMLIK